MQGAESGSEVNSNFCQLLMLQSNDDLNFCNAKPINTDHNKVYVGDHDQRTVQQHKFPFPTSSTKGAQLFPQCIFQLTRLGLTMVSVTCDGASNNPCMFSLCGTGKGLVYKSANVYLSRQASIFVSDPSHSIKTIRNCFSQGKPWVSTWNFRSKIHVMIMLCVYSAINGSSIDWKLVVELYQRNTGAQTQTPGFA